MMMTTGYDVGCEFEDPKMGFQGKKARRLLPGARREVHAFHKVFPNVTTIQGVAIGNDGPQYIQN